MSKFRRIHANNGEGFILTDELDTLLESKGFRIDTCAYGGGQKGWVNGYRDSSNADYYRIHITNNLIRVHYEYDCGGLIDDREYVVTTEHLSDIDSFVMFLDEIYEEMDI